MAQQTVETQAEITDLTRTEREDALGERADYLLTVRKEDGTTSVIDTRLSYTEGVGFDLSVGDEVKIAVQTGETGGETLYFVDTVRTDGLLAMILIFCAVVILGARKRAIGALLGLACSVSVLVFFLFPLLVAGYPPVPIAVVGIAMLLLCTMTLSHGFTKNTFLAYAGCVISLMLAYLFSSLFVEIVSLSGLGNETSTFLLWESESPISPKGILLAAILIGTAGVLDDVCVTQVETVAELSGADPHIGKKELFVRATRLGTHHIASTVNTLVLAYAGASLPLFLLFYGQHAGSVMDFLNTELVAEELVRTFSGTTALILAVPITTFLAVRVAKHLHVHIDKPSTSS